MRWSRRFRTKNHFCTGVLHRLGMLGTCMHRHKQATSHYIIYEYILSTHLQTRTHTWFTCICVRWRHMCSRYIFSETSPRTSMRCPFGMRMVTGHLDYHPTIQPWMENSWKTIQPCDDVMPARRIAVSEASSLTGTAPSVLVVSFSNAPNKKKARHGNSKFCEQSIF